MKRLLFLDFLRGFFILYVLVVHVVTNIFFTASPDDILTVNPTIVAFLFPVILISTWAPIFAFISGTANVYVMYKLIEKDPSEKNLRKQVLGIQMNSAFMILLSLVNMSLFHHSFEYLGTMQYTLITGYVEQGFFQFSPQIFFFTDALHIIGMSGFIVSTILFFLWRKGGFEQKRRNKFILTIVAFVILLSSTQIQNFFVPIYTDAVLTKNYPLALLLKIFFGPRQSTFPNVTNALFGAVFAIMIAQDAKPQEIKEYGLGFGLLFIGFDLLLIIPEQGIAFTDLTRPDLLVSVYMLNLGCQMIIFTVSILKMEYSSHEQRIKIARRTTGIRRFGLLALTIYVFEGIMSEILEFLYLPLWGPGFIINQSVPAMLLFLLLDVGMWYLILRFWEKINFKYSIEWLVVNIVGKLRGRKSSRLKVADVLYNPIDLASEVIESSPLPNFPSDEEEILTLIERIAKTKAFLAETVKSVNNMTSKIKHDIIKKFKEDISIKEKEIILPTVEEEQPPSKPTIPSTSSPP